LIGWWTTPRLLRAESHLYQESDRERRRRHQKRTRVRKVDFFFFLVLLDYRVATGGQILLVCTRYAAFTHSGLVPQYIQNNSPRRGTELWFVRVVGITQQTTHPLTDNARIDHEVAVQRVKPARIRRPVWPQLAALNSHMSGKRFSIRGRVESQAPPRCSIGATNSGGIIMASSLVRARVTKHLYQAPEDPRAVPGGYIRHHLHHHAY
jgi:hypothetical protein